MKKIILIGVAMAFVAALAGCTSETQASTVVADEAKAAAAPAARADEAKPETAPVAAGTPKSFAAPPKVGDKAVCPVMGGEFVVTATSERSEYQGKHVVFCCPGCKGKFDADPAKFLK